MKQRKQERIATGYMLPLPDSRIGARAVLAALVLMLCIMTGCAGRTDYLHEANNLIENGSYPEAIEKLDSAEKSGENSRLVHRSRGIAYMGLSDYERAVEEFAMALYESDGYVQDFDLDTSYYMAVAQYRSGDIKGANDTYSYIISLFPDEYQAYYFRGRVYLAMQDIDNAKSDFDKAVKLSPQDPDMYIQIFEAMSEAGLSEDGQKYLKNAMELNTKLSDYQKGRLYYCMGEYEKAKQSLEAAVKQKGDSKATLYLGQTYEALGDTNYAASLYRTYLESDPGNAVVLNQLGICLLSVGDYSAALDAFNKGIEIGDPSVDQSLRFNQVTAYEDLGDFDKAKNLMNEYLERYPGDEAALRENEFLKTR